MISEDDVVTSRYLFRILARSLDINLVYHLILIKNVCPNNLNLMQLLFILPPRVSECTARIGNTVTGN